MSWGQDYLNKWEEDRDERVEEGNKPSVCEKPLSGERIPTTHFRSRIGRDPNAIVREIVRVELSRILAVPLIESLADRIASRVVAQLDT